MIIALHSVFSVQFEDFRDRKQRKLPSKGISMGVFNMVLDQAMKDPMISEGMNSPNNGFQFLNVPKKRS